MKFKPVSSRGRVLVVEDEAPLREAMVTFLNMEQLTADGVGSLQAAEQWLQTHTFDVLILDRALPDGDALAWMEKLDLSDKGVIICTAHGFPHERVDGMHAGADAYLVKPVHLEELSLIIMKLMQRLTANTKEPWRLESLNWQLRSPTGATFKLTHSEATVVQLLAQNAGQAVSKDALAVALGHDPIQYDMRRLEVLIRRLRNKARESLAMELPLDTANRRGYAFTAAIMIDTSDGRH